jgi:hypothetical protein
VSSRVVEEQSRASTSSDKESSEGFRRRETPSIPGGGSAPDEGAVLRSRRISSLSTPKLLATAPSRQAHRTPKLSQEVKLLQKPNMKGLIQISSPCAALDGGHVGGTDATPRGSNRTMKRGDRGRRRALQHSATKSTDVSRLSTLEPGCPRRAGIRARDILSDAA